MAQSYYSQIANVLRGSSEVSVEVSMFRWFFRLELDSS